MNDLAPKSPRAAVNRRRRSFKMRLTEDEANKLKKAAYQHELTQADYVRILVLGKTAHGLPDAKKLQNIATKLAGISNNVNQCQKSINEARTDGTLTSSQFGAMYKAIAEARRIWLEPLDELKSQLQEFK